VPSGHGFDIDAAVPTFRVTDDHVGLPCFCSAFNGRIDRFAVGVIAPDRIRSGFSREDLMNHSRFWAALVLSCMAPFGVAQVTGSSPAKGVYSPSAQDNSPEGKSIVKSVDQKGRVTYSDRIVDPDANIQRFKMKSYGAAPVNRPKDEFGEDPKKASESRAMQEWREGRAKSQLELDAKQVDSQNEMIKKENCMRAKQNFAAANSGTRVKRVDEKGEPRYLSDAEIAAERDKLYTDVQKFCN
jgi:hypothetical protein